MQSRVRFGFSENDHELACDRACAELLKPLANSSSVSSSDRKFMPSKCWSGKGISPCKRVIVFCRNRFGNSRNIRFCVPASRPNDVRFPIGERIFPRSSFITNFFRQANNGLAVRVRQTIFLYPPRRFRLFFVQRVGGFWRLRPAPRQRQRGLL